jgi:Spy/CpxP family protein refolding chaperone
MFRASALLGTALMGVAFVVGTGASQDTGKTTTKVKTSLPTGWKDLGLTKEQVFEISKIRANYKAKLKLLDDQIKEAKSHEKQEMVKVLTAEQKDKLRKSAVGEDIGADTKTDTTKDKAKTKDK